MMLLARRELGQWASAWGKFPMSHSNSITQLGYGLTSKARKGCDGDKEGEDLFPSMFLGTHSSVRVLDAHNFPHIL